MKVTYTCECGNTKMKFVCNEEFGYECKKCGILWDITDNEGRIWDHVREDMLNHYDGKLKDLYELKKLLKRLTD